MPISDQLQTLMLWMALFSFIALLAGGVTNSFVIFFDSKDLMWSMSPLVAIFIGGMVSLSFVPGKGGDFFDNPASTAFFVIGVLVAGYGCYRAFLESVTHNGIVLGLVIGIFKMLIAAVVVLFSIDQLKKATSGKSGVTLTHRLGALAFLAVLWWFTSKLVNGEAYYSARGLTPLRS